MVRKLRFLCDRCKKIYKKEELKQLKENEDLTWLVCPQCYEVFKGKSQPKIYPILLVGEK